MREFDEVGWNEMRWRRITRERERGTEGERERVHHTDHRSQISSSSSRHFSYLIFPSGLVSHILLRLSCTKLQYRILSKREVKTRIP